MLRPQEGGSGGLENKVAGPVRRKFQPCRYQEPQDVPVGEDKCVGGSFSEAVSDPAGPFEGLRGAFTSRRSVCKEVPPRICFPYFQGCEPFVVSVVPFEEVGLKKDPLSESRKFGGGAGANEGTR